MKLLFIENRYATWVYEAVARKLAMAGHEIHWMVQNPLFAPRWGCVHQLPLPSSDQVVDSSRVDDYDWLRRTDRGVLHFGATGGHYAHYDQNITQLLEKLLPDVVFGEATEFHELLAIRQARRLSITYLSPNVTRYPADRLAFMAYDTLEPVGGDASYLPDEQADAMLLAIRSRQVVPSYMRPVCHTSYFSGWLRLIDKLRITAGWLAGERFITPSPLRKIALNREQKCQRQRWEERAARNQSAWSELLQSGKPWVLYALQMQPEGNIDVWGSPWNDQSEIIRRAARALAVNGATLVVKPNPKSKYEMSRCLNAVLDNEPNVIGLAHATPMSEVFPAAPLILAVTGTVLLESIFSQKPVASLGSHSMRNYPGVAPIDAPEDIAIVLESVIAGKARVASTSEGRDLLQKLHATSYMGSLWDPVAQPKWGEESKVLELTEAFRKVLVDVTRK